MLTTLGAIIMTVISFIVTACIVVVGYALAIIPQVMTFVYQGYSGIKNLFA